MKRVFGMLLVCLILNACTTAREEISRGTIKPGISKTKLRNLLVNTMPSEDAFMGGCFRQYFSSLRIEVLSSSTRSAYFIFENVTQPSIKCSRTSVGNGTLASIQYTTSNVQAYLDSKKQKNRHMEWHI